MEPSVEMVPVQSVESLENIRAEVLWWPGWLARWHGPIRELPPEKALLWGPGTGRMYLPMELKKTITWRIYLPIPHQKRKMYSDPSLMGITFSWKMPI